MSLPGSAIPETHVLDSGESAGPAVHVGVFLFDPADPIYADHFPGRPVVPGSMIIHAFTLAATRAGIIQGRFALERFKFRRFLSPGEYAYEIEVHGSSVRCILRDGASVAATGILHRCITMDD